MLSDIEKANMALLHLGITKSIGSFTENSNESRVMSTFFDITNEWLLRNYKWPFATKFVELALVELNPTQEWACSYRYPTDCLYFRRILNGIPSGFIDDVSLFPGWSALNSYYNDVKPPYKIGGDDEGKLIYCNLEEAQAEYTRQPDNALYQSDYDIAFSYRLAAFAAPSLAADKLKTVMDLFQMHIEQASATAYNEEQPVMTDDSSFTRAR